MSTNSRSTPPAQSGNNKPAARPEGPARAFPRLSDARDPGATAQQTDALAQDEAREEAELASAAEQSGETLPPFDRRARQERREARAKGSTPEPETGLERRRGVGRRRSDWARAAEEGEMNREQYLFVKAIDGFKRANDVMYPSWTDVLEVVRLLGYRKTLRSEINISGAEDWTEKPDSLSGVRSKPGHPERRRDVA